MHTKIYNKFYRFNDVDFEPVNRTLFWQNNATTALSDAESRLLEILCHHAGQVISSQSLYVATLSPDLTYEKHKCNLSSLLKKAQQGGEGILPLSFIEKHGYRMALPKKTDQREHNAPRKTASPLFFEAVTQEKETRFPSKKWPIIFFSLSAILLIGLVFYFILK